MENNYSKPQLIVSAIPFQIFDNDSKDRLDIKLDHREGSKGTRQISFHPIHIF